MLSIAFTISIIIVIKMRSYSTLRQQPMRLSSTYDTGTSIRQFSTALFHNPVENFAGGHLKNWHKALLYHIIHQNVADFWDLASTYDTFWRIKCYMYKKIHCIKCTYLFSRIFARLRRVLVARFIIGQGECRRFF